MTCAIGAGRQRSFELRQLGPDPVGDRERVGGRLAHDAEADRGLAVLCRTRSVVLRRRPRPSRPRPGGRGSRSVADDDDLRNSSGVARRESVLTVSSRCVEFDAAARQLDVLLLDRGLDVLDRQAARRERRAGRPRCASRSAARRRYRRSRRPPRWRDGRHRRASGSRSAPSRRASSEVTPIHMIAAALASTLRTTGRSAPSGRRAMMRATRSRTSAAAASGSRPR